MTIAGVGRCKGEGQERVRSTGWFGWLEFGTTDTWEFGVRVRSVSPLCVRHTLWSSVHYPGG